MRRSTGTCPPVNGSCLAAAVAVEVDELEVAVEVRVDVVEVVALEVVLGGADDSFLADPSPTPEPF